jgi:hypothetical protein
MTNLTGERGKVHMIVDIVRAKDGTRETHELVGVVDPNELRAIGIDPAKLQARPVFPQSQAESQQHPGGPPPVERPDLSRPVFPPKPSKEQA